MSAPLPTNAPSSMSPRAKRNVSVSTPKTKTNDLKEFRRQEQEQKNEEEIERLNAKVNSLSDILHKAKVDREALVSTISHLESQLYSADISIREVEQKRILEQNSFRRHLSELRGSYDVRTATTRKNAKQGERLLIEWTELGTHLAIYLSSMSEEHSYVLRSLLKRTFLSVPGTKEASIEINRDFISKLSKTPKSIFKQAQPEELVNAFESAISDRNGAGNGTPSAAPRSGGKSGHGNRVEVLSRGMRDILDAISETTQGASRCVGNALEDSFGDMLTVTPKTPGGPDALSTIPDVQIDQQDNAESPSMPANGSEPRVMLSRGLENSISLLQDMSGEASKRVRDMLETSDEDVHDTMMDMDDAVAPSDLEDSCDDEAQFGSLPIEADDKKYARSDKSKKLKKRKGKKKEKKKTIIPYIPPEEEVPVSATSPEPTNNHESNKPIGSDDGPRFWWDGQGESDDTGEDDDFHLVK